MLVVMGTPRDVYTHGHHESVLRSHRWRTAANSAAYLLPYLRAGQTLLDVGCGPGTITLDLARAIAPGRVVGVDRVEEPLAKARATAAERDVPSATFAVGDVYALDWPDRTFDVVHAHQLLQHLSDPVAALAEMRRVCRTGGLVAARDSDYAAMVWHPSDVRLNHWLRLYTETARGNAGEPNAGRRLRAWALDAGFAEVTSTASTWCFATAEERHWWASLWAERITMSPVAQQALERGLATRDDLDEIARGWGEWAERPDGWFTVLHGEVLCRA